MGAEIERARLDTGNLLLSDRLETRKAVDRAKGILQPDLGLSESDAHREIAEAIVLGDELKQK